MANIKELEKQLLGLPYNCEISDKTKSISVTPDIIMGRDFISHACIQIVLDFTQAFTLDFFIESDIKKGVPRVVIFSRRDVKNSFWTGKN